MIWLMIVFQSFGSSSGSCLNRESVANQGHEQKMHSVVAAVGQFQNRDSGQQP